MNRIVELNENQVLDILVTRHHNLLTVPPETVNEAPVLGMFLISKDRVLSIRLSRLAHNIKQISCVSNSRVSSSGATPVSAESKMPNFEFVYTCGQ